MQNTKSCKNAAVCSRESATRYLIATTEPRVPSLHAAAMDNVSDSALTDLSVIHNWTYVVSNTSRIFE